MVGRTLLYYRLTICVGMFGYRMMNQTHVPPIKIFEKLPHKNAIKHDPPDFLTTRSTPSKEFAKKTQGPPLDFQLLCIDVTIVKSLN